jgi:glucosamine--fructose-6-phosphate aminotransferase (isomerizing)
MAREGKVLLLSDAEGISQAGQGVWRSVAMPACDPFVAPILYAAPVQLLAYHAAVFKGTDVDQPRNLAKSVTVE